MVEAVMILRFQDHALRLLRPYADFAQCAAAMLRAAADEAEWTDMRSLRRPFLIGGFLLAVAVAAWRGDGDGAAPADAAILAVIPAANGSVEAPRAVQEQVTAVPVEEIRPLIARPDLSELAELRLKLLEQRLESSETERRRLETEFQRLQREMISQDRRMADLAASQSVALGRMTEQSSASVEALSKLVARTGIDPDRLIAAVRRETGLGGPYVQVEEGHYVASDVVMPGLGGPMLRLEALRRALGSLPLETPMADSTIASFFGVRRDPFNNQLAIHGGLDLVGPLRAPIMATAPGTVVFAGRNADYGNMVEIEHGYGIRTRYGHLSKISVKVGDALRTRSVIGLMGNTGRSTGAHLHYEVAFEGNNLDPLRFIEAKRYVVRGEPQRTRKPARQD
jgi:murein DD-endopeptidase MepM/ murein hydrolase activator NlpD